MRNFSETGERVTNTKKNSPLRRGGSRVQRTIFGIGHEFTCLREISVKVVTGQYQFQQDHLRGLFIRGRNIFCLGGQILLRANQIIIGGPI